jgi:hypothetical protein
MSDWKQINSHRWIRRGFLTQADRVFMLSLEKYGVGGTGRAWMLSTKSANGSRFEFVTEAVVKDDYHGLQVDLPNDSPETAQKWADEIIPQMFF